MLIDFLNALDTVLDDEKTAFESIKKNLRDAICVNFLPAVTDDLFPIHILHDTKHSEYNRSNIYLVPCGASDFWAIPHFSRIISKFYNNEPIKKKPLHYGIAVQEMILLRGGLSHEFIINNSSTTDVVYIKLRTRRGNIAHIILLAETPENVWDAYIERYDIPLHFFVESNKGLGAYFFEPFPVHMRMLKTQKRSLLPTYYFSGKFSLPLDLETVSTIPEYHRGEGVCKIHIFNRKKED